MSVTQEQWFERLVSWTPAWFFETSNYNRAVFKATAKILYSAQQQIPEAVANVFISEAQTFWLDLLGYEFNVPRLTGEADEDYAPRIALQYNPTVFENIFNRVKAALNNGDPVIYRNYEYGFADDDLFADDTYSFWISGLKRHNWFTILIPAQLAGDETAIKAAIVAVVDKYKGFGTSYDVVYGVE